MYKDTANRMPKQAAHGYAEVQPAFASLEHKDRTLILNILDLFQLYQFIYNGING